MVKSPQDLTGDDWDAVYETNLRGAWVLAQELIKRRLADGRECSIVNIASVLGLRGIGHVAPYAAAKAGLINVGRDLSTDLAKHGIRINSIAPGYIETEMNQNWLKTEGGVLEHGMRELAIRALLPAATPPPFHRVSGRYGPRGQRFPPA